MSTSTEPAKPAKPPKAQALKVANGNGQQVVVAATEGDFAQQMLAFARDPTTDASKVKVFWEIQERILEEQRKERAYNARLQFFADKARAQAEFPIIGRDSWNDQTKSNYARFETIWEICCPIWTKYGFAISFPSITTPEGLIKQVCHITHPAGHEEDVPWPDAPSDNQGFKGTANKTVIQGNQSTISYLKRGLLCAAMGIVTAQEDDDGQSGVRKQQANDARQKAETKQTGREPVDSKRPPVDWVERMYNLLTAAPTPRAWETTLSSLLPAAPSATELSQLSKRLKGYVDKIPDRTARSRVVKLFHDRMAEFTGDVSDKKSDTSDKPMSEVVRDEQHKADARSNTSDKMSDTRELSPDEQWAEDEISTLQGVWSMDVFLVMANKTETQTRMKRLSASGQANRDLYERVKKAYETRQTFIAREASK
jgi:hypothetical protein